MYKWFALFAASLFFLFEFVARIEPSIASLEITQSFGITKGEFGTLSSVFFWVYAPMQIFVGLLLDRHGARKLLIPASLLCASGVIFFSISHNIYFAGLGRFITGLGASFAFVGSLYVINHYFKPQKFAFLSGGVNAFGMFGTAIGTVALTPIISNFGWRDVFLGTGCIGLILFTVLLFLKKDPHINTDNTDNNFLEPLFIIIKSKRIWLISLIGAFYYMPVNVFGGLWGHEELITSHHLSSESAEVNVSMIFWGLVLGSLFYGYISDFLNHRKSLIISGSLLTLIFYSLVIFSGISSEILLSAFLFLGGFFGGAQMLTFAMAKEGESIKISGTVIAFVNMIGIGSALIFQPLIGFILDLTNDRFDIALSTIPLCLIMSTLLIFFVREEKHEDHYPQDK